MAICVGLSLLAHLFFASLAALLPVTARTPEDVMVVDLADLPRVSDFLPPKPGILEERPKAPPPKAERRPAAEPVPKMPSRPMEGRVPDLPVNPALPPEERFPEPEAREARERPIQREAPPRPAPAAPAPPAPSGAKASRSGGKPLKDLTPSLAWAVNAAGEKGGRGSGNTAGDAVGTAGKAGDRGGIVEEGGATLKALNAPEIQYISYFAAIKRKIELMWGYPATAAGLEGEVVVDFVISRTGKLDALTMVRGSGYKALDEEAVAAVRKASPYAPIPPEYRIPNLQIRGHFVYTVTQTRILR